VTVGLKSVTIQYRIEYVLSPVRFRRMEQFKVVGGAALVPAFGRCADSNPLERS
jgi:hypothetical protein